MPSQSHCSHTVALHPSACPPAVGPVVSSQALSCCCGAPLTGPAAVVDCSNTDCSIISSLAHRETGMTMKRRAFQAFSPFSCITAVDEKTEYDSDFQHIPTVKHRLGHRNREEMVCNFLIFHSADTDDHSSKSEKVEYISGLQFFLTASYRNPDSAVIVKEGALRQHLWIIETWKERKLKLTLSCFSHMTNCQLLRMLQMTFSCSHMK